MPTMLNVHEAKANLSGVLSEVEDKLTIITIMLLLCRKFTGITQFDSSLLLHF